MVAVPADRRAGPSGPPSTAGSVPATAETLQAELREMFRPDQEPVADYLTRIARIVLALRAHGVAVSSAELDMLTTKASLLAEEFGQVGGDWHPTIRMVRRLRTRFSVAALKGTTAMPPKSRRRSKRSVSSSLPSAAGKAPAPTRFGAPLPRFPRERQAPPCRRSHRRLNPLPRWQAEPVAAKSGAPTNRFGGPLGRGRLGPR